MRHLGFMVDLMKKSLHISGKQIAKVLQYFDHFLAVIRKKGRIRVKQVRRMLGLQVWIGTVFRVARQYLTSACDLLRATQERKFFFPEEAQTANGEISIRPKILASIRSEGARCQFRLPTQSFACQR